MTSVDPREAVPITVELFVPDVDASVRFYTEKLGFALIRLERGEIGGREQATFAIVGLERAVMLIAHKSLEAGLALPEGGGSVHVRIMVDDVDALYQRARHNGVAITNEIADRPYGLRDFIVRDPDGFQLRFASPLSWRGRARTRSAKSCFLIPEERRQL